MIPRRKIDGIWRFGVWGDGIWIVVSKILERGLRFD